MGKASRDKGAAWEREVAKMLATERRTWAADAWDAAGTLAASGMPSDALAITARANAAELRKATP